MTFWWIVGIIVVIGIIVDIFKWFCEGIDSTGKSFGLSKNQTNSIMNFGSAIHMEKNDKDKR